MNSDNFFNPTQKTPKQAKQHTATNPDYLRDPDSRFSTVHGTMYRLARRGSPDTNWRHAGDWLVTPTLDELYELQPDGTHRRIWDAQKLIVAIDMVKKASRNEDGRSMKVEADQDLTHRQPKEDLVQKIMVGYRAGLRKLGF